MNVKIGDFESLEELLNSFRGDQEGWEKRGSITLLAKAENIEYDLWIVYINGKFMLKYMQYEMTEVVMTVSLFSLNDESILDTFYEEDEAFYPASCFLDASTAERITAEFCNDPTQPPPSANWLDFNDLPWPSAWETREELAARGLKTLFTHLL